MTFFQTYIHEYIVSLICLAFLTFHFEELHKRTARRIFSQLSLLGESLLLLLAYAHLAYAFFRPSF